MVSAKITIKDPQGLHARPAAAIYKTALRCTSSMKLINGDKTVDLKDILAMMSAGLKAGTEIELQCEGTQEEKDLAELLVVFEQVL